MSDMCGARGPMPPAPAIGTRPTCTRNSGHEGQHVEANVGTGPFGTWATITDDAAPLIEARW